MPVLTALDALYHFTESRNSEIRFAWLTLVVEARLTSLYPAVTRFITEQGPAHDSIALPRHLITHHVSQVTDLSLHFCLLSACSGRMKYIRPLYRQLYDSGDEGRQLAVKTFTAHRSMYHAIASKMVGKDLKLAE